MKHTLTEAQCESILKKHGIITTGYITKETLYAALREAFQSGNNVDVMKMKYKEERKKHGGNSGSESKKEG